MWVESVVHVGDQSVSLAVERLDAQERERTAAILAWLTLDAIRSIGGNGITAWHEFVSDVLREHVTFAVADKCLQDLGSTWWSEVVSRALLQFVHQNDLAPSINRHLQVHE
jgi:hypothetical protein